MEAGGSLLLLSLLELITRVWRSGMGPGIATDNPSTKTGHASLIVRLRICGVEEENNATSRTGVIEWSMVMSRGVPLTR